MIRTYVDMWGQYNYVKIAEHLLECNWKLAELNRDFLTQDEMNRYKIVIKALNDLEKDELKALAIRYYMPNKFRSYGKVIPTTYPKTAEILGINRNRCENIIYRALDELGKLVIQYWEQEKEANSVESKQLTSL